MNVGYACNIQELECVEDKDSNTTLKKCEKYCKQLELPRGMTLSFAYSLIKYFFNSVIGYETKLQYPFPKEYGYILQDDTYIELSVDVDDREVKGLRTDFYNIYENKLYILSNVAYIISGLFLDKPHLIYRILHGNIRYSHTQIEKINIRDTDRIEDKIEADRKNPITSINKDFIDLLHSS